jgi:uncharacterized membrane protein
MSASGPVPWRDFSTDPRDPAAASLRASDRDRDIVLGVLAESFADGRLDRQEYDERVDVVSRARTLGELPPALADLVPPTQVPREAGAWISAEELDERALRAYHASRREAFSGLLILTVVLSGIWLVLTGGHFYWPIFVIVVAAANLLRLVLHKQDIIEKERRRLARRRHKNLDPPPEG